jgi:phthiocerol/phenolphthiocerol synthesis type-I polyketide synthase E
MREPMPAHAIAIVGMAGRFPQADGLEGFWRNIVQGVESLATLTDAQLDAAQVPPALRAHPSYVRRGTFIEQAEYFDAAFFGYAPREAQVIDPQHRVFLECAWEALEHAGYAPAALPESVGVYAGASMNSYVYAQLLRNPALAEAVGGYQIMLGNDKDFLCTRVSYKLGLRGPSMTVQTACSTSLVAVQVACRALQRAECDMALAGGVSLTFPLDAGYLYQEGMILSPDGHCRPFDAAARGTRAGAGAGIVVLKRLDDALAAGDTVHAVIRGIAVNNDGAGKAGYTAPSVEGQVEVIATAQALAGVSARSIGYVEAHGTATPLGDPIEIAALTQAFRASTSDAGFCHLGSLKANIGHLDAAAGVAGLIKAALVLQHRERPPLVNFRAPNPALQLERSPFTASAAASAWASDGDTPRRAAVSSFGIGGTNAHAVLEEAPAAPPLPSHHGAQLIVLSAKTTSALDAACTRLAHHLQQHPEQALADVAYTLQHGREAFAQRRAWVVSGAPQAIDALRASPQHAPLAGRHEGSARPVAFLFSGQGSQHAAMGRGLYAAEPVYRDTVDRCAAILQPLLNEDLRTVLHAPDSAAALAGTRLTQPALFVTEYALAMLWQHWGVVPQAMLGHSIGEYVAAHLAGVMSLDDALAVVAARGRLMQQQNPGAMAAVHLGAAQVQPWLDDDLEVAAVNAPALCTVSGPAPAIERLLARLAGAGIDARALHTSHAFHSAMMAPAVAPFLEVLSRVRLSAPTRRYISNLSGTWITPEQATSPAYYAEHLRRAVQFEAGMRTLAADATLHFIEVGPGSALTSLARLNLGADGARRVVASMRRPSDTRDDRDALLEAAGRLWVAGVPLRWPAVHGEPRRRVPLPTYPFERKRFTVEPGAPVAAAPAEAASPDSAAVRRSNRIDDWFYAPTWARDDSAAAAQLAGHWLVLGNGDALAHAVCAALRARGAAVSIIERADSFEALAPAHWRVRPSHVADDLARVLPAARRDPAGCHAVNLWSLPSPSALPAEQSYALLVALGGVLAGAVPARVLHCTAGAESVLDEPILDAHAALAAGPVLVLPMELPGVQMRSIDLELHNGSIDVTVAARAIAAEAALPANEPQVARRGQRRWVRRHERLRLPSPSMTTAPLRAEGRYLISGGLGGMGLALARWLGTTLRARLLLTARSALPPRDTWDTWLQTHPADERNAAAIAAVRAIEAAGGAVIVAAADAADRTAMAAALAQAHERFGGLDGVVHAAGIAGRGSVALRTTPADAQAVFAPKVQGLQVLVELLDDTPLEFVALMSSINAVVGAAGACDYAAANAVLDAFAESRARPAPWRRVVSIAWGAWREVGMAAKMQVASAMQAHWRAHLAGAIAPEAGVEAFARVLADHRPRIVVDTYDLVRSGELVRQWQGGSSPGAAPRSDAAVAPAPAVQGDGIGVERTGVSADFVAPAGDIEQRLAVIWGELLGIEGIGAHDDFFELGGHSLMATRVLSRIDEALGVRLALRDVFDAPTVHRLAARVAAAPALAAAPADDREELEF